MECSATSALVKIFFWLMGDFTLEGLYLTLVLSCSFLSFVILHLSCCGIGELGGVLYNDVGVDGADREGVEGVEGAVGAICLVGVVGGVVYWVASVLSGRGEGGDIDDIICFVGVEGRVSGVGKGVVDVVVRNIGVKCEVVGVVGVDFEVDIGRLHVSVPSLS